MLGKKDQFSSLNIQTIQLIQFTKFFTSTFLQGKVRREKFKYVASNFLKVESNTFVQMYIWKGIWNIISIIFMDVNIYPIAR